jgi:1-acyl-sn-glycerol-3-phosphate acyltransferase
MIVCIGGWGGIKRVSYIARIWGSGIARIIGLDVRIHGDPNRVHGGIIISNHQSYLDIIVHASVFPIRFAPKAEIATWPFLGWFLALSRPIWVRRESKQSSFRTLEEYRETLEHDINLIIYPEGTTSDGKRLLPFKSTPFEAVSSGKFNIWPILVRYHEEPGRPTLCWYGDMTLLPHCWEILGRKSIRADLHILDPLSPPPGLRRKELAVLAHSRMEEEFFRMLKES